MNELLQKIRNFFAKRWDLILKHGETAIKVTDLIKSVIENPALDYVVLLTPIKGDDILLSKAKKIAPRLSLNLGLAMSIIKESEASEKPEIALGKVLGLLSKEVGKSLRPIFYRELSGAIAEALSDGKISGGEAIALVQLIRKGRL